MANNVIYLSQHKPSTSANVVSDFLGEVVDSYSSTISRYNINTQDVETAFDIATIQFLMRGMAHRSQGQEHPSQLILNALRDKMLP